MNFQEATFLRRHSYRWDMNSIQPRRSWLPGLSLVCIWIVVASCRREAIGPVPVPADSTALFSAFVNGVGWQTDSIYALLAREPFDGAKVMTITGYAKGRVITVSMRDTSETASNDSTLALGRYGEGSGSETAAFAYSYNLIQAGRDFMWQQQGVSSAGQATVTACDGANRKLSGNFNFTVRTVTIDSTRLVADSVQVTGGVLRNITYTYFRHP